MPVSVRDVTFEDVAVLKHALDSELVLLAEKSDVAVALLVGLSGQVLASYVPNDLSSDAYRLMSMVQGNIPYLRREIAIGRIQQSIARYEAGNVVATRVGTGELLLAVLGKESSVSANLPHIHRCAQILTHISSQKAITEQELSDYGEDVAEELATLTRRLYAELESTGTVGEKKKNEEVLAKFKAVLGGIIGQADADIIMVTESGRLGIQTKRVSQEQWQQFIALIRQAVERKAGRYYAEMAENRLVEIVAKAEEMF